MDKLSRSKNGKSLHISKMALIVIGVITFLFLSLRIYFGGDVNYYYAYVKCGQKPVVATSFAASYTYTKPGDKFYDGPNFWGQYFCTEQEAQAAGFRPSVLAR